MNSLSRGLVALSFLLAGCVGCDTAAPPAEEEPQPVAQLPACQEVFTDAPNLKVAAWNIQNLRDEDGEGSLPREPADYSVLSCYAKELSADVVALQEVDGPEAAARVFDPEVYDFYFETRNSVMNTGFAVRKELQVVQNEDLDDLNVSGGLRHGVDITVETQGQRIRMLSVHLKSRCFDRPLDFDSDDCDKLSRQVPVLEEWIDARAAEETPFLVLGDFNRRFDADGDEFYPEIDDAEPPNADLTRVTEGLTSQCENSRFPVYIDHILLDRLSTQWLVGNSFEQILFSDADMAAYDLSDHCPIAVTLDLP
ncbi:MAG: endonuclease/exonuclease/phosphatase family protein [Bacteroidota bacterium]